MKERWEYLAVIWQYSSERTGERPVRHQHFQIHRGKDRDEKREFWSSKKADETGPSLIDVFNELGEEGWELTSDAISHSMIVSESEGWSEVGAPIRHQYIFKRRLDGR